MMILKCRLTTVEAMLGTASNNKEIHSEFIASHAPDAKSREEEIEAVGVEETIEKGMTVFPRNKDGQPILWDYQIKGFFKDACSSQRKIKGSKNQSVQKKIDGLIFIEEREILIQTKEPIESCWRFASADSARWIKTVWRAAKKIGSCGSCYGIFYYSNVGWSCAGGEEWLSYGKLRGLGQWRKQREG